MSQSSTTKEAASAIPPHTKVSRQDWIDAALRALRTESIDQLKVLSLSKSLSVSRSSFYWYFENPAELRDELLALWDLNTTSIVDRSNRESDTIVAGCLGVFECWADPSLFHPLLDLAVRDWSRRDATIAQRVAAADNVRLDALTTMFGRHEFGADDALVRARLLYHSQVGYFAVDTQEPMQVRLGYLPYYLEAMTGTAPTAMELKAFAALVEATD